MTMNLKLSLGLIAAFALALLAVVAVGRAGGDDPAGAAPVVRDSSHRLATADTGDVTFVEFLDFECEACGAAYPVIEQLRQEYGQRVTFVIRYFPLPSHFNSRNAALAVEAAAQQGRLRSMYQMMFQTQAEWGEQRTSQADRFRGYAQTLGMDMVAYDAAIAAPATAARVQLDIDDGTSLGVTGTPTFFLDGEKLEAPTGADLRARIDEALEN